MSDFPKLDESPTSNFSDKTQANEVEFTGNEQSIISKSWKDQPEVEKDLRTLQDTINVHNKVHDQSAAYFKLMADAFNITIPVLGFVISLLMIVFKENLKGGFYYISEIGPLITPLLWLVYKWYDPSVQMQKHTTASAGKGGVSNMIEEMLDKPIERRNELAHTFRAHIDSNFTDINGRGPYLFSEQLTAATKSMQTTQVKVKKMKSKKD